MKNKGIAINTILLLVVGIIVVVAIVYLVYTVTTTPTLSVQQCKTKIIQYCILCANNGWEGIKTPQELIDCGKKYPELSAWSDNDQTPDGHGTCDLGPTSGKTKEECKALGVG